MKFKEILEAAICAPSGDNCQPWEFKVEENRIHLFNLPDKDTSLFNYRQRASLIAHGAVLENISIASSALGYQTKTTLFPETGNDNFIATIVLNAAEPTDEPLNPYIHQRTTNRRRYRSDSLTVEEKTALLGAAEAIGAGKLLLVEDSYKKGMLAAVIGLNDRMVFENPYLHSFLFDHVRWNDEEARQTRDGLDIKTLELAPPDALAFRLFKNFSLLQTLNNLGVSRIVANNAKNLAMSASAIGMITVSGSTMDDYLLAGRTLQRVWLEATRMGLSFQLMTGITFLMQRVREGETADLSSTHVDMIKGAWEKVRGICRLENETLALLFRVGHSGPPSVQSLRLSVERVVVSA